MKKEKFYDKYGEPVSNFNEHIISWLHGVEYVGRPSPKAFVQLFSAYKDSIESTIQINNPVNRWAANRNALSGMTEVLFAVDMKPELLEQLSKNSQTEINAVGGFRTPLAQSSAKNIGEHFANLTVYSLADSLKFQDEILVTKGIPPQLRSKLTLKRVVSYGGSIETLNIPIEVDFCIFKRSDPTNAIIVSAKTSLKQTFHQATMYKLFFDCYRNPAAQQIWNLYPNEGDVTTNMSYVFTTADMIKTTGHNTEGPDIQRSEVRNLIKLDSSFFDYTFVSKRNIPHVSTSLSFNQQRESLFHEMGCLLDLIQQKFEIQIPVEFPKRASLATYFD